MSARRVFGIASLTLSACLLVVVFAMSLFVLRCSSPLQQTRDGSDGAASYLVVMSAFSPELTRLLEETEVLETGIIEGDTCHVGSLRGVDVVLLLSGIGLEKAEAKTRAVLDSFDVSGIVFSGIAGGINPNLNIGDVTVPAQWAWVDGEADPGDNDFWIPADTTMLRIALAVSRSVTLNTCTPDSICLEHSAVIVTGGSGVSNSFFVDDREYREWLWHTFSANAVDMETAAVAGVARDRGIAYIAFRSLSDLAGGGPGANEINTFFQLAADNAAAVVLAFLEAWAVTDN